MRIARSTGAVSGLLIALLGVWGAVVPFVGPYFDYSFGVNSTWHYTDERLLLCILPGVAALIGGLAIAWAGSRQAGAAGGWLALTAGAWFVVGPALSRTWEHAGAPIGAPLFGSTRQALELIGYFFGLGALIVALAAFAAGRFASRPAIAAAPAFVATPAVAPALAADATPVPVNGARRSRRGWRSHAVATRTARRRHTAPDDVMPAGRAGTPAD